MSLSDIIAFGGLIFTGLGWFMEVKKNRARLKFYIFQSTVHSKNMGEDGMSIYYSIDLTCVNMSDKTKRYSEPNLQFREMKKGQVSPTPTAVPTPGTFNISLEHGQSIKRIFYAKTLFQDPESATSEITAFTQLRFEISDSSGKTYRSKWEKTNQIYYQKPISITVTKDRSFPEHLRRIEKDEI